MNLKTKETTLLTPAEAAKILGLTPAGVRAADQRGDLRCLKTQGGRRLYTLADVEDFKKVREEVAEKRLAKSKTGKTKP